MNKDYAPGRIASIPAERRQGFDYWRTLECTHNYNDSPYYNEVNTRFVWQQYDAISQTDSAIAFMTRQRNNPFLPWPGDHRMILTKQRQKNTGKSTLVGLLRYVPTYQSKLRPMPGGRYVGTTLTSMHWMTASADCKPR